MKLSNFELVRTNGDSCLNWQFFAMVDVTTESGFLFWKKKTTTRREISRYYGGWWFFTDTGAFTPGTQAEELARAYKAKTGKET